MISRSPYTAEQIQQVVIAAHGDMPRLQQLLAAEPGLLNVMYEPWQETPLGAASHVGHRTIAEFLLAEGAPLTICAAAMLGRRDAVARFIAEDPAAASARGAHGIPVLTHAGMSGDIELARMLVEHGDGAGKSQALFGAVAFGHAAMVKWLLEQGADPTAQDFQGRTPLELARATGQDDIAQLLAPLG